LRTPTREYEDQTQDTATSNEAESIIEIHEQGITPAGEEKARAATEAAEDARATVEQQQEAATVSHFLLPGGVISELRQWPRPHTL